jgi:hypothetical protein
LSALARAMLGLERSVLPIVRMQGSTRLASGERRAHHRE